MSFIKKLIDKTNRWYLVLFLLFFVSTRYIFALFLPSKIITLILPVFFIAFLVVLLIDKIQLSSIKIPLIIFQVLMMLIGIVVALINKVNIVFILTEIYVFGLFLLLVVYCIENVSMHNAMTCFTFLEIIYYIDFVLVLYQFFILKVNRDFLGGIFGIAEKNNQYSNMLFTLIVTYSLLQFFFKKRNLLSFSFIAISSILMAAFMELKYYFIEFAFIIIFAGILYFCFNGTNKFLKKYLLLIVVLGVALVGGFFIMLYIFPSWKYLLDPKKWIDIATQDGYDRPGAVNRLKFVDLLNKNILKYSKSKNIFGLGFGATEVSIPFLNNPYTKVFKKISADFFSITWLYVDCGIAGVILYICSFLFTAFHGFKILIENKKICTTDENRIVFIMCAIIISLLSLPMLIYNCSMRIGCAVYYYFAFACLYIANKNNEKGVLKNIE